MTVGVPFSLRVPPKSFDKVKGSGLSKFLTPDQIKQGDANIAQLGNKINQDIPGTQAFRFKNVAMSINQKNLKASYDMEQSVTESDLIIQDWNKDYNKDSSQVIKTTIIRITIKITIRIVLMILIRIVIRVIIRIYSGSRLMRVDYRAIVV